MSIYGRCATARSAYNKDMVSRADVGREGEDFACGYLVEKGFSIIERNYRKPFGEIDVVARASDGTLVFVEVKMLQGGGSAALRPEDELSAAKIGKFKKIALFYANRRRDLVDERRGWRLDAVCLTKNGNNFLISHYENIESPG